MIDSTRPQWQEDRGPRYGNQRKQIAELKLRARRNARAQAKRTAFRDLFSEITSS